MYSFFKEMCSSQISQSNHIYLYIHEMVFEASIYDGLAAKIIPRSQNILVPLLSGCVHALSVNASRRTVLVHSCLVCFCLEGCTSKLSQYFCFKILVSNARAFNEHIYCVDIMGGDFSSLSINLCLCVCSSTDEQYLLQNHGYCQNFIGLTNISWCS